MAEVTYYRLEYTEKGWTWVRVERVRDSEIANSGATSGCPEIETAISGIKGDEK